MPTLNIPIVVVAFDRVSSLKRILGSLEKGVYACSVKLIICIDGGGPEQVIDLANQFIWDHGEKEVICQSENIGLRAHILKSGRLALKHDGIVLLEDDLYVSPYFYQFMLATQTQYADTSEISGVALYSPQYSETACLPFTPIDDGSDVYFMHLACSWGQSWLSHQWRDFEVWHEKNNSLVLQDDTSMPPNVRLWPDISWKKYFIKYNIENNKFFVYPRASYTTNFGDTGENHTCTKLWQVPLATGFHEQRLPQFADSFAKYDASYEILPESLKQLVPELQAYNFTVDLYGLRGKENILTEYVLSRNDFSQHILAYGCEIKPHELNIIDQLPGDHFKLGKTRNILSHTSFLGHRYRLYSDYKDVQSYFYAITPDHYSICVKDAKEEQIEAEKTAKEYPALKDFTSAYSALTADFIKYFKSRVKSIFKPKI